ncbi:DUF928 domain-containing protein, partial [Leptolyngbya cf. ectocarpi LEGE 11479]
DTSNKIGNVYLSLNQHDQASDYYRLALELRQQTESAITSANSASSVGPQHAESVIFQPADISFSGNRTGSASRGASLIEGLTALVPETNYGRTTKPYPTIFIYLPEEGQFNQDLVIEFYLRDEQGELKHAENRAYPEQNGILGIPFEELENIAPLEVGKRYQWHISVRSASDDDVLYLSGWIHRVEPTSSEAHSMEISLEEQSYVYAREEIWYDALAILIKLRQQDSTNLRYLAALQALLESVGLEYVDIDNFIGYWLDKQQSLEADVTNGAGDRYYRPSPDSQPLPSGGSQTAGGHR